MSRAQWAVLGILGLVVVAIFAAVVVSTLTGGDGAPDEAAPATPAPILAPATSVTTMPPAAITTTAVVAPTTAPPATVPPTTTTVATTTTTTPTTLAPAGPAFVLIPGGFQSIPFGLEPDGVVAQVATAFGEPTDDTGWIPSSDLGPCPGDEVRQVSWGELSLLFSNEVTPFAAPGARHFTSWIYTGPASPDDTGLKTGTGIGIGSTRGQLDAAYGERLQIFEDQIFGTTFRVDYEDGGDDYIYLAGALTDPGPDAVVIGLSGGRSCGE